jgi:hypothetical protein
VAEGDALYREGDFGGAVEVFEEWSMLRPSDPAVWDRLAAARYRAGDAEGAARAYDMVDRLRGGDAEAAYNAGNAHYKAHRLDSALERYERALKLDPTNTKAQANQEVVARELEARRQNQKAAPEPEEGGSSGAADPGQAPPGSEHQPGEPGEPPQDADQGPPQDGSDQPSQNPSEQPASDAQPGESKEGHAEGPGQVTDAPPDGSDDGGAPVAIRDVQGTGAPPAAEAASPNPDGPMTEAQAKKLLEGVEEGRPRVMVPGEAWSGKPW